MFKIPYLLQIGKYIYNYLDCISINSNNFGIQPIRIRLLNFTIISHHRILQIIVKETRQKVYKNPKTNILNGNIFNIFKFYKSNYYKLIHSKIKKSQIILRLGIVDLNVIRCFFKL